MMRARQHNRSQPSPSQHWHGPHADDETSEDSYNAWTGDHFPVGSELAVSGKTSAEQKKTSGLLHHPSCKSGTQRGHPAVRIPRRTLTQRTQQGQKRNHGALSFAPLHASSVTVRPFAHGEVFRRPPHRVSGREELMSPSAARLSTSLASLEPHGFHPRLLDKEALCAAGGISRGAPLTSHATVLRQKQLQFRHRVFQSTHKSARLVRLITVMRADE